MYLRIFGHSWILSLYAQSHNELSTYLRIIQYVDISYKRTSLYDPNFHFPKNKEGLKETMTANLSIIGMINDTVQLQINTS